MAKVAPLGDVWIELLFESPGHVRLPDSDDEIIDRALGAEPLANRKVTLLTYDTGSRCAPGTAGCTRSSYASRSGRNRNRCSAAQLASWGRPTGAASASAHPGGHALAPLRLMH